MSPSEKHISRSIRCLLLLWSITLNVNQAISQNNTDTTVLSTKEQALLFLDSIKELEYSRYWPNIEPAAYLQNLRMNVENPLSIYEGRNTNFCSYAAVSYLPLHDNPLTYVRFMLKIFSEGKARYGKVMFRPSDEIRRAAGTLAFKGELDIRPADQLWFLLLADHFKGYLNMFDHHYNNGDEDKLWAAVNYAKFNRMIRRLFNYNVKATGSDIFRPGIKKLVPYLQDKLRTGTVFLYVNNLYLYKKNHRDVRFDLPTHYITLLGISESDGKYNITYWDYGSRTLRQVSDDLLRKIIFGITHVQKKYSHEK